MSDSSLDSVCGMRCGNCKYFGNGCKGCEGEKGAPFWTSLVGVPVCPVYGCCKEKQCQHCGRCAEMPCGKFTEIRDPEMTDEQADQSLQARKAELLRRASIRDD